MEEMLLVATRRVKEGDDSLIRCVTLYNAPSRIGEAGEVARAIEYSCQRVIDVGTNRPVRIGADEIGKVIMFDAGGMGTPWSFLGASSDDLAFIAEGLTRGELTHSRDATLSFSLDMSTLGEVFEVGPTHDLIGHLHGGDERGAFEFYPVTTRTDAVGKDRALWKADSKAQRQLMVLPTHKGVKRTGSTKKHGELLRSTVFYARGIRWTSQALLVASTERRVLGGSAWTSLGHKDKRVLKAFALWANSIFGLIVQWVKGQRTQLGRSRSQIKAIQCMPCPCFGDLADDVLDQAELIFDEISKRELLPACQAHVDGVRKLIDNAVIDMMGLDGYAQSDLADLRRLWCSEPSVHGQNKKALSLLDQYL